MRIAFVNQPWNTIDPPVESPDSIAILIYEMARRIAHSYEVTIYSKKGRSQVKVERHEGVTYKRISTKFDLLLKPLNLLDRFRLTNLKRPFCSWIFYYFWYARKIARDLRKNNYDIVHVFTFSNFIPIIRYYNPEIKIVLHMEDHSLTQRDRNMINRRLEKADLVIGCSHFITDNI
ncbi:MAG: glycosyltransferase, partial [Planctomycetota bacterium]